MKTFLRNAWMIAAIACAGRAFGDSATLTPSADTSLFENQPDNNLGASLSLVTGLNNNGFRSRELMRFNLAGQIPSNAVIQSVVLTVQLVMVPGGGGAGSVFDMHRLLVDWNEGIGASNMGLPANAGETTWAHRFYPDTPWTVAGGGISNDFSADVSASTFWDNFGTYTFGSTSNLVADVQQWVANPGTNFGWMFISESEDVLQTARRIGAREDTNNAPSLLVQYTLPVAPTAPVIQNVRTSAGTIQFSFAGESGHAYAVQYRDSLNPGLWQMLTNVATLPAATNVTVGDTVGGMQRFYRVAAQ